MRRITLLLAYGLLACVAAPGMVVIAWMFARRLAAAMSGAALRWAAQTHAVRAVITKADVLPGELQAQALDSGSPNS